MIEYPTLWLDFDFKIAPEEEARKKLAEFPYKPTAVVSSGNGLHVYWSIRPPAPKELTERVVETVKEIAEWFGMSLTENTHATAVLRIPGTWNTKEKYPEPRPVVLESLEPENVFDLSQFDRFRKSTAPPVEPAAGADREEREFFSRLLAGGMREGDGRNGCLYAAAWNTIGVGDTRELILIFLGALNRLQAEPVSREELETIVDNAIRAFRKKNPWWRIRAVPEAEEDAPTHLEKAIVDIDGFLSLDLPPRKDILPWLAEQHIGLIPGWRGVGKTWFGLSLLDAISRGDERFGPWPIFSSIPCLYIDGEMAVSDVQERMRQLIKGKGHRKNPMVIDYSDAYASTLGISRANLLNPRWRSDLKSFALDNGVKLVAFDNISSLAPGVDENSKKDWDPINQWLLDLRFAGITTLLFHHTGKEGDQRGTSGREDNIDFSLSLVRPSDYHPEHGARFIAKFKKIRFYVKDPAMIQDHDFQLTQNGDGAVDWTCREVRTKTVAQVLTYLDNGIRQKDVAAMAKVAESYVSVIRKKARNDGYLNEKNGLTAKGKKMVKEQLEKEAENDGF